MRLTTVILIATLMQVSAAGFAQRITLKERKSQLENVLQKIHIQSGYDFVFDRKVITKMQPLDVTLKNASLEDALDQVFNGLPLTYIIDGKTILIKPKKKSLIDNLSRYFAAITVTGRLLDEKGLPLPGASIKVKGTNIYSITDKNGAFTLANVDENAVILISFIGYDPIELKAKANMGAISLKLIDSKLDEVQVIGYGTTTRRFNTGSVTTIKSEDIKNQTVISSIQALQGMVPGLFIQQGSGMPGASSKVSLRGTNSLSSGTVPLYIIDGVPFDGNPVERSGNTSAEQGNGSSDPLNAINPQDIASIDVLKDADATAIYGARGANGVIIITTKYASSGATTISGTVYSGISKIRKFVPVLSTAEFLDIRRAAFVNDNITPTEFNAPDLKLWSQTEDTNYQKYMMGNNAPQTDVNLSVSGGNSATGLYLSGSYRKEGTVYPADYGYKRGSMHAKAYHTSINGKFRAEFSTIYSGETNKMPATDIANITTTYPNNYPLYNPDGTLYFHPDFQTNPLALVRSYGKTIAKTLMMNAGLQYNLLSNLKLKVNAGQNSVSQDGITIVPSTAGNPTLGTNQSGGVIIPIIQILPIW